MEFRPEIQNKVDLFWEVFNKLETSPILENPDFHLDEFSDSYYLKFKLNSLDEKLIPMQIHLTIDGIQLDIAEVNEIFEWGNKDIEEKKDEIVEFFIKLFTSYILIEEYNSYKIMLIFDGQGKFINKYNLSTSLSGLMNSLFKHNSQLRLFMPIYHLKQR